MPRHIRGVPHRDDPQFTRPPTEAYQLPEPDVIRHQLVNQAITNELVNRVTGRGRDSETLIGKQPTDQYFAGALGSQYKYREAQHEDDSFQNIAKDVAPFVLGAKFKLPVDLPEDATVTLTPSAFVCQRRFPTYDEQQNHGNESNDADVMYHNSTREDTRSDGGDEDLLQVYDRFEVPFSPVTLGKEKLREILETDGPTPILLDDSIREVKATISDKVKNVFREPGDGIAEYEALSVPDGALTDKQSFNSYIDATFSGNRLTPLWSARLEVNVEEQEDELSVTARLVNTHGENYPDAVDPNYEDWRATLFDVELKAELEGVDLMTFDSERIGDEYLYDGTIYGIGQNCSIEPIFGEDITHIQRDESDGTVAATDVPSDSVTGIRTETIPTHIQSKYLSRDPDGLEARFDDLSGENGREVVFDTLREIAEAMDNARSQYKTVRPQLADQSNESKPAKDFREVLEDFENEYDRFTSGIRVLKNNPDAYESFCLLNQTFSNLGDKFKKWRLFQIIFVVMSIPDIVDQAGRLSEELKTDINTNLDVADVIYFPTGGGKTEAYLGLVTFTAFHDRLRGKTHGVTALTKFPLRFLSLQQLQRVSNVLGQAELLRRTKIPAEKRGEEFSVGYFVGKQNTPNKLVVGSGMDRIEYVKRAASSGDEYKQWREDHTVLQKCPYCGQESVKIDGDRIQGRIVHKCTADDCDAHDVFDEDTTEGVTIPVHITDREVYRYAPTFVVSTIDKISIVGMQRRVRSLWGQTRFRCEKHGYASESKCPVDTRQLISAGECSEEHHHEISEVDPPSLLIQDELHLLREEFGAFDSHYETFLQAHFDKLTEGKWDMKIVAATATIEGSERQVGALYQKNSSIFPSDGPRLQQSFYAYGHPNRVGRRMIGAVPRTVSRTYAIEKIHEEYARIVQDYQREPEKLYDDLYNISTIYSRSDCGFSSNEPTREDELQNVLDDYEVQISYHHSKDNTDLLKRVVRTMVNVHLRDDEKDYRPLVSELMTGETPIGKVKEVLKRLTSDDDELEPVDMLIATSMISHGVDVDRLNFIGFFGLPRRTAEYIQTYSRVGRKHAGSVFLLHDPIQTRDRSYYTQFQHYQEYQDLLVEATPLERWAEFAIECTMPGIFCAALLQYYDYKLQDEIKSPRPYIFDGFNNGVRADNELSYDDMFEFVKNAYGVENPAVDTGTGIEIYRSQIEKEFKKVWRACQNSDYKVAEEIARDYEIDEGNYIPTDVLERANDPPVRRPMRNLRDIDEQLEITPDYQTGQVINLFRE